MVRLALDGLSLILLVGRHSSICLMPNAFRLDTNWMGIGKMNDKVCSSILSYKIVMKI